MAGAAAAERVLARAFDYDRSTNLRALAGDRERADNVLFALCFPEVRLDAESREKDFAWHPEASFDLLEFVLPPIQAFAATRDAPGRNGFVEIGFERLVELRLPIRRGGRGGVWREPGKGQVESHAADGLLFGERPKGLQKLGIARDGGCRLGFPRGLIESERNAHRPAKRQHGKDA
jgi:hypothetical protein